MLQDVEAGRRTEIDVINGAVVRIGEEVLASKSPSIKQWCPSSPVINGSRAGGPEQGQRSRPRLVDERPERPPLPRRAPARPRGGLSREVTPSPT